jgi:MFS-type transporter involved in bile tolerance (Atg22 family)
MVNISTSYLLIPAVIALISALIADYKGRNFRKWLLYGLILFPVAFIHSLWISKKKQCPFCAELIQSEATICKHCHKEIKRAN